MIDSTALLTNEVAATLLCKLDGQCKEGRQKGSITMKKRVL